MITVNPHSVYDESTIIETQDGSLSGPIFIIVLTIKGIK